MNKRFNEEVTFWQQNTTIFRKLINPMATL